MRRAAYSNTELCCALIIAIPFRDCTYIILHYPSIFYLYFSYNVALEKSFFIRYIPLACQRSIPSTSIQLKSPISSLSRETCPGPKIETIFHFFHLYIPFRTLMTKLFQSEYRVSVDYSFFLVTVL